MEAVSTSNTPALPVELLVAILENLQAEDDGKQALLAFRLASKDFATLAASPLFRVLNLSWKSGTSASVISLLKELPDLAALVREINFDVEPEEEGYNDDDEHKYEKDEDDGGNDEKGSESIPKLDTIEQSVRIFSHLHLFPVLKTLRLHFPSSYEHCDIGMSDSDDDGGGEDDPEIFMTDVRILQIKILVELANFSTKPNALNTIRTFHIHGLITQPNRGARLDGFKTFLQGITNLSISTVADSKRGYALDESRSYRSFWTKDIIPFLTAPIDLTSFQLLTDFLIATVGPSCTVWDSMNWPNLRSASLGGIIFNDSFKDETTRNDPLSITGVEAFLLRHPSLVELELQNCFLSINIPEFPSPRMWADIFEGFGDKLVNLKKFTLYPIPFRPYHHNYEDYDNGLGYVHPGMFRDYDYFFSADNVPLKQDANLDAAALESLQATVIARQGPPHSH